MSDKHLTYHEQRDIENTLRLRDVLNTLPPFAKDYFRAAGTTTSTNTRIKYAYDLRIFFEFLVTQNPVYRDRSINELTLDDLDRVTALDIEEYIEYLRAYRPVDGDGLITNGERGIKRKMSALRTFYAYFYRHELIKNNPAVLVDMPKLHDKEIVRLDADEVARLLDIVENGDGSLTPRQKKFLERSRARDTAILTLLLGTGIRVSECVGLDVEDIDFRNNGIKVFRKGGNEMIVYFGDEVEKALKAYLKVREGIDPAEGHEHALFYSSQRKRMNVKSVENLVKKYARCVTTTKKITPHKLRSTYGTALYQETGDIYLVADVLGHKDVNTTKRHYAAMSDQRRRSAAKAVRLREDMPDGHIAPDEPSDDHIS